MVYITDNREIYNHVTSQRCPASTESIVSINQLLKSKNEIELTFIVNDRYLKEDEISDFDILVKYFDIIKTGCFPRIKKGDVLILKENNYFICINF